MAKSRGIATFILTLGFTTLIITACETQQERERAGEATPSPTARVATSPTTGLTPGASPATSPVAALTPFDKEFVTNAARGSLMEVQLGNVAAQRPRTRMRSGSDSEWPPITANWDRRCGSWRRI